MLQLRKQATAAPHRDLRRQHGVVTGRSYTVSVSASRAAFQASDSIVR